MNLPPSKLRAARLAAAEVSMNSNEELWVNARLDSRTKTASVRALYASFREAMAGKSSIDEPFIASIRVAMERPGSIRPSIGGTVMYEMVPGEIVAVSCRLSADGDIARKVEAAMEEAARI